MNNTSDNMNRNGEGAPTVFYGTGYSNVPPQTGAPATQAYQPAHMPYGGQVQGNAPVMNNQPYYGGQYQVRQPYNAPASGSVPFVVPHQPYGSQPQSAPYGGRPVQPTPAMVYYSNQNGSAPQYHYGNPTYGGVILNQYYRDQLKLSEVRQKLAGRLKVIGNLVGGASLATIVLSYVLVFLMGITADIAGPASVVAQIYNAIVTTVSGSSLFQIAYTLVAVGLAFFIFRKKISVACVNDINTPLKQAKNKKAVSIPLGRPKGGMRVPLLILIGFGGCLLANYIVIILSIFYSSFGLSSSGASGPDAQSAWDIVAMVCSTAIVPALVEEFALRGIVMTPLRKFGNGFAILISSFVFGIFHGDLDQIPFAFICGLFMGYAVVMTESLWTGVIIHAMNNSISCVQAAIIMTKGDDAGASFFFGISFVGILVGVLALIIYLKKYKKQDIPKLQSSNKLMNTSRMFKTTLATPAMIISIILFVITAIVDRIPV